MAQKHRIVIVGGGAGGLELATQLGQRIGKKRHIQITLVDATLTHIWKPLLHEIAAGTLNGASEEINYFAHAKKNHYKFQLGSLQDIDRENQDIILAPLVQGEIQLADQRRIPYDTLVIAIGSTSNDFGTPGAKENCHFLDNRAQADIFQRDLLNLYLQAHAQPREKPLNITIIGAGATGVELAAELHQAAQDFHRYGLDGIDPNKVKINVIEAAPRILPALSEKVATGALQQLHKYGIHVYTQHKVEKIDAERVYCQDGKTFDSNLKVWAAGIKAPAVTQNFGLSLDRIGRIKVYATLQSIDDPKIFAFGDCAHCQPIAKQPVLAPRAQVASQQAAFLIDAILAKLKGKSLPMFKFTDRGSLVSLTQNTAIGELLGNIHVEGLMAKTMYHSLYRVHQAAVLGYTRASLLAARDLFGKGTTPLIKLH
ncbi:NAD(P)/FAD-dependent oxidoreductase [Acinetobacter populi]|uniref:FAD-dependent oxidoreductase n=1 Tax=Acinetobacter populi TaxID=1582270 RepID=A0A1Z9YY21_9GAMM|nr:NAD(P)/FAD-dependent oxidoreductase [Acinetobacter populi]OUY07111.1 FAD-dependent oxidoreductase [Acinetobacter populi]